MKIKKLTYWVAECLYDSSAYSIRCRTRREVRDLLDSGDVNANNYGAPRKVTVEYTDTLDLLVSCMGESRGWWEA